MPVSYSRRARPINKISDRTLRKAPNQNKKVISVSTVTPKRIVIQAEARVQGKSPEQNSGKQSGRTYEVRAQDGALRYPAGIRAHAGTRKIRH